MSILFNPGGTLNISTDPSDLQEIGAGNNIIAFDFTRAKNIDTVQVGRAKTRPGSLKLGSSVAGTITRVEPLLGVRYSFTETIIYRNETSIETGLTSINQAWTSIQYNAFNDSTDQIFATNGTELVRIEGSTVYQWGISAPTSAGVTSVGAAGSLTGNYTFKYTYCRKVGAVLVSESNGSPVSNTTALTSQQLDFTFTTPSDPQVTHIRIYRSLAGTSTWFFDQEITVGTTSGTSTQADAALGDGISTDHDRPVGGTYLKGPNYNGTCFLVRQNLLYYCLPKQPEYWPATYFIEVSTKNFPGTTLVFWNGQPYYFTKNNIYFIQGTGHPAFQPINLESRSGAQGPQGAYSVDNDGIYHVGIDGIYLFNGTDTKLTESNLEPIFLGQTVNGIPAATDLTKSWIIQFKNKLFFGYVGTGTYCDNVIVMYLDSNKKIVYYNYPFEIVSVEIDHTNNYLLAGCSDGFIRILETGTDDDGTAIDWEIQSKDYTLATRAHFPRWAKYDVDITSGTVTGKIILDDTVLQTHNITLSRNTKRRLIASNNGQRCAFRISGTGVATFYSAEME